MGWLVRVDVAAERVHRAVAGCRPDGDRRRSARPWHARSLTIPRPTTTSTGVFEALPDGPVDAIGFSLGAITLLQLAMVEPQRFNRLVLAGIGAHLRPRRTTAAADRRSARSRDAGEIPTTTWRMFVQYATARQRHRRPDRGDEAAGVSSAARDAGRRHVPDAGRDRRSRLRRPRRPLAALSPTRPADLAKRRSLRDARGVRIHRRRPRVPRRRLPSTPESPGPLRSIRPPPSIVPRCVRRWSRRHPHRDRLRPGRRRVQPRRGPRIFEVKGRPVDHPLIVHIAAVPISATGPTNPPPMHAACADWRGRDR